MTFEDMDDAGTSACIVNKRFQCTGCGRCAEEYVKRYRYPLMSRKEVARDDEEREP